MTLRPCAPSATRMPISCVCCATVYAKDSINSNRGKQKCGDRKIPKRDVLNLTRRRTRSQPSEIAEPGIATTLLHRRKPSAKRV